MDRAAAEKLALDLLADLTSRQFDLERLQSYYDGNHPLPNGPQRLQDEYRQLMVKARSNWMALVVDAVTERMRITGFRIGDAQDADADIWKHWRRNRMAAKSEMLQLEAVKLGEAYAIIAPGHDGPVVTVEHPTQVIVRCEPCDNWTRIGAVKAWVEGKDLLVTLYEPDAIWRFVAPKGAQHSGTVVRSLEPREDGSPWVIPNLLGEVPVVPFRNAEAMLGGGLSEISGVTDIQDRINETIFNRLLAAQFAAFRQKWVTGMEIPVDPATNMPIEPFKTAVDRLFMAEDPGVKFGEFTESDLRGYITSVEADIQHLAAITRTPPHYLLGQSGAFPSGESLKATETGLVAKVRRRMTHFGDSWTEVARLIFATDGDPRADDFDAEVIWADPESRSEAERVDALVKMASLGVPHEALWERWQGVTQEEIARWKAMQTEAGARAGLGAMADFLGAKVQPRVSISEAAATAPGATPTGQNGMPMQPMGGTQGGGSAG